MDVIQDIATIYSTIVHWKKNLFQIPSGKHGKAFVSEMARLYQLYADASFFESVSIKAAMVLPALILQKPFRASKSKDYVKCVERRMQLWKEGKFHHLFEEAAAIQTRVVQSDTRQQDNSISQRFADLMKKGNVRQAMRLIDNEDSRILPLDERVDEIHTVRDVIHKHPESRALRPEAISNQRNPNIHPIVFEEINGSLILTTALQTDGGAGPSGLDARAWKRMCSSFQRAFQDLCAALAACTRRIFSSCVDPEPLQALTSSTLIALDKCPGVRPIGFGEVPRRIMSKAILHVVKPDIMETIRSSQLCIGQSVDARPPYKP